MSYIRMDKALCRKPKFRRIVRETGLQDHELVGYLFLIWSVVDELGQDFEGSDDDIACAVCAPSALLCALCAVGWAERFQGGITFKTNDPMTEQRTEAHRARAAKSYERKKASLRADSAPLCASAPPPYPPSLSSLPIQPTDAQPSVALAPTRDAPRSRSKPKDAIRWDLDVGWQGITVSDREAWAIAYPACTLDVQLARADQWLRANPAKAKKSLWRKFLVNWLSRSQDSGGDARSNGTGPTRNGLHPPRQSVDERATALADLLRNAPSRRENA